MSKSDTDLYSQAIERSMETKHLYIGEVSIDETTIEERIKSCREKIEQSERTIAQCERERIGKHVCCLYPYESGFFGATIGEAMQAAIDDHDNRKKIKKNNVGKM